MYKKIRTQLSVSHAIFIGVMAWPDTYNDEVLEINYNMSDKKDWMKMSNILKNFLERTYLVFISKLQI